MKFRDLDKARAIIENATGLDVAYAYDDLIFPEHSAFILQFDDDNVKNMKCYFHEECEQAEKDKLLEDLRKAANTNQTSLECCGAFNLEQKGENVEIKFI